MDSKFDDNLNSLILEAKFGNREAIRKLWILCQPIVNLNVKRFSSLVKGFRQYRDIFYNESYVFFWDIINSYDFNGKYCFFYYLGDQLLEKTTQKIKGINLLPEEFIERTKLLDFEESFEPLSRETKALRKSLKKSTPKQLQAIHLKHFRGMSNEKAGRIIGITYNNVRRRLVFVYRRTKRYIKRLIKNERQNDKRRTKRRNAKLSRQKLINERTNGMAS